MVEESQDAFFPLDVFEHKQRLPRHFPARVRPRVGPFPAPECWRVRTGHASGPPAAIPAAGWSPENGSFRRKNSDGRPGRGAPGRECGAACIPVKRCSPETRDLRGTAGCKAEARVLAVLAAVASRSSRTEPQSRAGPCRRSGMPEPQSRLRRGVPKAFFFFFFF